MDQFPERSIGRVRLLLGLFLCGVMMGVVTGGCFLLLWGALIGNPLLVTIVGFNDWLLSQLGWGAGLGAMMLVVQVFAGGFAAGVGLGYYKYYNTHNREGP